MSVYPLDAPLPRFKVTRVEGRYWGSTVIDLRFTAEITNYEELAIYWENQGRGYFRTQTHSFIWVKVGTYLMEFYQGKTYKDWDTRVTEQYWGKWNTLAFKSWDLYGEFSSSLYFCDVYVPLSSELPSDVWTDLQFTVSPPIPEVSWIVPALFIGLFVGIGVYGFWRYRK